jgi:hypothetical protein
LNGETIANIVVRAIQIRAAVIIGDLITIAHVHDALRAKSPNRVLQKSRSKLEIRNWIAAQRLDQIVVFGEAHLRHLLSAYAAYYNQARPHRSLRKDAPLRRAIQQVSSIVAIPILGGLHHQYVRI